MEVEAAGDDQVLQLGCLHDVHLLAPQQLPDLQQTDRALGWGADVP